ncbi:MAG TPA: ABC transporter permease [Lachnospiraceae bacterium]|nr:ABC transporter permease [Lachnospiraceae bacterium]
MRWLHILKLDMKFQLKYGFYLVYFIVTVLYVALLAVIPKEYRETTAVALIFSDPAAMGLFFMGAVLLLEKSQRVLNMLAASPVRLAEYMLSKIVSFVIFAEVVAVILALAAGNDHIFMVMAGTAFSSVIFTLIGMIAAAGTNSLNQFILLTIPIEIICFVPALLYLFGIRTNGLRFYPLNFCMSMLMGETGMLPVKLFMIAALIAVLSAAAYRRMNRMFKSMGGMKL